MREAQLTSKDNPLLKTIRLVGSGSRRAPKQLVVAEGIRVLEEVEKSGCDIEAVVISEDFGSNPREQELGGRWSSKKCRVCRVNAKLFQAISTVQTPQGAIALVHMREMNLTSIPLSRNSLLLYLCGIQDPGNLGTIIRTAAAVGTDLVCTSKGTVSPRNAKAIRSSAGSFFRVPVVEHIAFSELQRYCKLRSLQLFRTDPRDGVIYTEADLRSPCAILLGNEGGGLVHETFSVLPAIRIPMSEGIESLNVAVAGSVILFEASRQRRFLK